ncbi:MAG: hypothetical protein O9318_10075 [Hylemonella sp.]|uniref:hypothetical protein n=1 Tax=Hylemonella sp. TaxID=2066020 RepID=UPI0022CC0DFC|nr:hypothetical protein [Hylemonella sp.]MCZ8252805.1 hypothetical protein [Hylemonella sp.]
MLALLLTAAPALAATARYRCEAVYMPARSTWVRSVEIAHDLRRVQAVRIDGVPVHSFAVDGTVIRTALDNERIAFDTAALGWQSDFRGLAQAQGRCERE